MTKKNIAIAASCAFVVIALVAALIFIFSGDTAEPAEETKLDINGTWRVVSFISDGTASIIENEFMVFEEATAYDYRDDFSTAYVTTPYTFDGNKINLSDIYREYSVESVSDNIIRFYQDEKTYMHLVRYPSVAAEAVDPAAFEGKWLVECHSNSPVSGEYLDFKADGTVDIYRNDEAVASANSAYSVTDNILVVDALNKNMTVHFVSADELVLVETDTGFNWELSK